MDEKEIQELDDELRKVLRAAGLERLVDDVDATIAEGRSKSEKRQIDKGAFTEELVAIEYTSIERYELLLDATRRAVVEPGGPRRIHRRAPARPGGCGVGELCGSRRHGCP